jgi:hypothetical protein
LANFSLGAKLRLALRLRPRLPAVSGRRSTTMATVIVLVVW